MICEIVSAGARTVTSNDVVMISTRRFVPVVVIFVAVTFAVSSPRTEMRTVASVTPLRFFRSFPKGIVTVASYDVAKLDRSTVVTTSWLSFCSTVVSPATLDALRLDFNNAVVLRRPGTADQRNRQRQVLVHQHRH